LTEPLISIIVPVYKVEAYLDKCVSSIVGQTYQNLEILLVDDGSPDKCPAICDAWAQKDSRIKVIHKPNGGGAQARNFGLEQATGAYVGFVDSDDFILPGMFESLYQILQQTGSDISECGYISTETDDPAVETVESDIVCYDTQQALLENINDRVCRQLVWNKLYARSTVADVRFVEGKFIDDEFFTYRAIGNAKKIAVTQQVFYCYRQQAGSAMHQTYSLKWLDAIEAKQRRLSYIAKNFPELVDTAKYNLLFTCMYHGQLALRELDKSARAIALSRLKAAAKECACNVPMPLIHKCWALLAKWNFVLCCKIRNLLGVGL